MNKHLKERMGFLGKHAWLMLILGWAAALRLYQFGSIPFVADEFSALSRLKFNSFLDLINQGVLPDFHPAGTHFFLWIWGNAFGFEEWVLKLPFALMGLASIWMIYRIGTAWFNKNTGLVGAAFASVSQYFILYSQIARPYGMGLFFCLVALWYWKQLVFNSSFNKKAFIGWVFAAAAVAYTHYFALLFLVLVGASGLFFLNHKRLIPYLLGALAICVLYLPHFWIFFTQLSKGGVESWLAKPTWSFFPEYLRYLLHYDRYFAGAFVVLFFLSIRRTQKTPLDKAKLKLLALGLLWWIGCFLIGYFYSIYNSAILQFSGLLFAAPFGLLALFYALRFSGKLVHLTITSILLLGTYSLVANREHYFMLYHSPYEQFVKHMNEVQQEYPNSLQLLAEEDHIYRYYADRFRIDTNQVLETIGRDLNELKQIIDTSQASTLAMGLMYHAPKELLAYAQDKFPYLIKQNNYYQGSFYVYSKESSGRLAFIKAYEHKHAAEADIGELKPQGYAGGIELDGLSKKVKHKHDLFTYAVKVSATNTSPKVEMASAIMLKDSIVYWRTGQLLANQNSGTTHYYSFSLPEKWISHEDAYLKCFLWNLGQDTLEVKSAELHLKPGNPFVYGLYENFK
jgi:hypothetical protein